MYLSKIELHNIRCFEDLTIDLEKDNQFILWTTILGDNAVGKSTILRCIAMGLCDETSAGALMKEPAGEFLRKGEIEGYIKIELKNNSSGKIETITTNITKDNLESPEKLRQKISDSITPWKDIFFCGYGVHIRDGGGDAFENYKPLEAVYTLFNNNSDLQNPETILLRQNEAFRSLLTDKLLNILMLEGSEIEFTLKGMFITGPWGRFRINDLSDGYRSTTQWIVDFFGWAIIADKLSSKSTEIEGILLIDELETHLHPKWQRYIVDRLKKQFPKVQIIITTHSPIIALGTADQEEAKIIELAFDPNVINKVVDRTIDSSNYKGYRVDQILTSSAFNLSIARSGETGDKMIKFKKLFMIETRTEEENKIFLDLKKQLESDIPEAGETESDRKLQRELKETLEKLNEKLPPNNK
ncbi:MAG: AAA family ATPase [Bacteroidetes bacterium]|nr:AAA family ATPase [Bacteroidota bacterium]MBU2585592.1 AAA family ATPase [Bacteroidota bacterium]